MKKKISCALLALLLAGQMMGAVSVAADETKTTYTAVERLAPQFEGINGVSDDGILTVQKGDKWGFVDITGKTVIDYKYDYASEMVDGVAVVGYLSEKEPYVEYLTKVEKHYIDLYIVDKTGKETRLPVVDGQIAWSNFTEDADGKKHLAIAEGFEVLIQNGVIVLDESMLYKYDGTPIVVTEDQFIKAIDDAGSHMIYVQGIKVLGISDDGVIAVRLQDITGYVLMVRFDKEVSSIDVLPGMYRLPRNSTDTYQYTADEYGICYAYASEDGYTVAYNQHMAQYDTSTYQQVYLEEHPEDADKNITYTPGFGVMNADGEWVIEPVYDKVRTDYGQPIHDGYVSLMNQDGYYGLMTVEGEIVIPFEYHAVSSMINGYTLLYKEEGATGVITDANGQAYTITDADGNVLAVDSLYMTNTDNNVRRITTTDGKSYLLSGTPDGTTFQTIEDTENMNIIGWRSSSGQYWATMTDAGYGIIEIVIEETTVAETVEETEAPETEAPETAVEETEAPETVEETEAPETEAPETEAPETVEETEAPETEEVTVPVVKPGRRYLPVRGRDAVKQFARISKLNKMLDSVYAPVIRH